MYNYLWGRQKEAQFGSHLKHFSPVVYPPSEGIVRFKRSFPNRMGVLFSSRTIVILSCTHQASTSATSTEPWHELVVVHHRLPSSWSMALHICSYHGKKYMHLHLPRWAHRLPNRKMDSRFHLFNTCTHITCISKTWLSKRTFCLAAHVSLADSFTLRFFSILKLNL